MPTPREIQRKADTRDTLVRGEIATWVDNMEARVARILAEWTAYSQTEDPRLFAFELRLRDQAYHSDDLSPSHVRAIEERMLARGWHHAVITDPRAGMLSLGVMRRPVVVRLADGSEFDAEYGGDSEVQLAETIAQGGTWRYLLGGPVFIPPHQIESVRLEPIGIPFSPESLPG